MEKGEYVGPAVIREMKEETGLTVESQKSCGIKEFRKNNGTRYIVFLYTADRFSGQLTSSDEGEVFWYPLDKLRSSKEPIDGFAEMLDVFTSDAVSEVFYADHGDTYDTMFCRVFLSRPACAPPKRCAGRFH